MGVLNFAATISLDGYAADAAGDFQWTVPSDPVFDLHLERIAAVSTEVLGRKTYELMKYWEHFPATSEASEAERAFARRWQAIEKVAVSTTLTREDLASDRSQLVDELGLDQLQQIVDEAAGVVEIFGPTTAAEAIRAGMVGRFEFFVVPIVVGGGLEALPDGANLNLRLDEHRVFRNGLVYLRYVPQ